MLPVGFVHTDDDKIALDPDESVREAIATVFRRFASSARAAR